MENVAIIIPAYNEEKRIGRTLTEYLEYFKNLKASNNLDFKIVVVLNGCTDGSCEVVRGFEDEEIVLLDFERGGKGFAVIEGFKYALGNNFDLIGFVDADCSTPPNAFYGLIRNIGDSQGIIANRWDKKSQIYPEQTKLRRFVSRGFNVIVRSFFLLPHRDTQCGAKLFKKNLLEKIVPRLGSSEWSFDVDLLFYARRERARIKSVPTLWSDSIGSKINLKRTPAKMFCSVVRLRLVHSPFKDFVRLYRKLPSRLKFHSYL